MFTLINRKCFSGGLLKTCRLWSDSMQANPSSAIDLPAAAVSALMDGEIVHAIQAVRQTKNMGFSEAKRVIERYIMCDPGLRRYWARRRYAARNIIKQWGGASWRC